MSSDCEEGPDGRSSSAILLGHLGFKVLGTSSEWVNKCQKLTLVSF